MLREVEVLLETRRRLRQRAEGHHSHRYYGTHGISAPSHRPSGLTHGGCQRQNTPREVFSRDSLPSWAHRAG